MTDELLVDELLAAMEAVRQAAMDIARALRIPLVHEAEVPIAHFDEDGKGWGISSETVVQSCLNDFKTRREIADAAFEVGQGATLRAAAAVVETFGFPPTPPTVWLRPDDGSDRVAWTDVRVVRPTVMEYLLRLRALDSPDQNTATEVAADLLNHARNKQFEVVVSLLVDGFETDTDTVELGDLSVRRLDRFEAGAAGAAQSWSSPRFDEWHLPAHMPHAGTAPRHLIQIRRATDAEGIRLGIGGAGIAALVLAFELSGFHLAGNGFYSEVPGPRWLVGTASGNPIQIPAQGGALRRLTVDDLSAVRDLALRFPTDLGEHPTTTETFALHRFMLGCARREAVDAVVDYVIAMEAVLLRGQRGESTFRFAAQGSAFLEPPGKARLEAFNELKDLYAIRSDIVHGGKRFPAPATASEARQRARDYATRVLMRAVTDGWPTRDFLLRSVLQAGPS